MQQLAPLPQRYYHFRLLNSPKSWSLASRSMCACTVWRQAARSWGEGILPATLWWERLYARGVLVKQEMAQLSSKLIWVYLRHRSEGRRRMNDNKLHAHVE